MPQVNITDSTSFTEATSSAGLPVTGWQPMFESVAAIIARSRQVTRIEHCWKYRSRAASASSCTMPKFRSRWTIARLRWPVRRSDS